jgi:hypothetical protein
VPMSKGGPHTRDNSACVKGGEDVYRRAGEKVYRVGGA